MFLVGKLPGKMFYLFIFVLYYFNLTYIIMKKVLFSLAIVCAGFLLSSCGTSRKVVSSASLQGEWKIVEVDGQPIMAGSAQTSPFIGFNLADGRIYGSSGCNRMMGTFTVNAMKPGSLSFGPIGGTRMACPNMTVEQRILSALQSVTSFKDVSVGRNGLGLSRMALYNAQGNQVLLLQRDQNVQPISSLAGLAGEWTITAINKGAVGASQNVPFIGFNLAEARIYGNAGCNSFNGSLNQEAGKPFSLNFGPIATTMMACADMTVERQVLDALNTVKSFKMLGKNSVGLYDADGMQVLTLAKK